MINTLKQDLRSTREDPRDQAKSKHEDWNQAVRKIAKKRAYCGDQTLDKRPDAATGRWVETRPAGDRTQERSVRSSTVRFQSGISTTGRVRWQATGHWTTSDQCFAGSTVGTTGRVRSGQFSVRSVAELREFDPNGYFLSGAYKYNPQPAI